MRATFPKVRLGPFLRHRKDFFTLDDTARYKRVRVQLHNKGILLRDVVEGAELRTKKQQVVRAGDLLVAEIDAKVGGFGIVPPELNGAIVSSHYFLYEIDESLCQKEWLDAFIRSGGLEDQVKARGTTNYAAIRPEHVFDFEIPLPGLAEQQRIVARTDDLAAKIEAARSAKDQGLGSAKRIFRSTVRSRYHNLLSENGNSPLSDLVTVFGGGTPAKSNPFFWEGNIPWVSPKDMKAFRLADAEDHISESAIEESAAKLIEPGAVLVVIRGMILSHTLPVAVTKTRVAINQDMKALIPRDDLESEYLGYMLRGAEEEILQMVERSSHDTRRLGIARLLSVRIPVLKDRQAQKGIVRYLDDLQTKVDELKRFQAETAAELDALLPSILDKAFKGEL